MTRHVTTAIPFYTSANSCRPNSCGLMTGRGHRELLANHRWTGELITHTRVPSMLKTAGSPATALPLPYLQRYTLNYLHTHTGRCPATLQATVSGFRVGCATGRPIRGQRWGCRCAQGHVAVGDEVLSLSILLCRPNEGTHTQHVRNKIKRGPFPRISCWKVLYSEQLTNFLSAKEI